MEDRGTLLNPLVDDDDHDLIAANVPTTLDHSFGDFSSNAFNPDLVLDEEEHQGTLTAQEAALPPLSQLLALPVFARWEVDLNDTSLPRPEKQVRLEAALREIENIDATALSQFTAAQVALNVERTAAEEEARRLRVSLGVALPEDLSESERLKRRDSAGVLWLTIAECTEILTRLMKNQMSGWYFNAPVTSVLNYTEHIPRPMDFSTIKINLNNGIYNADTDGFITDVRQVFFNCEVFNLEEHESVKFARIMSLAFETVIRDLSQMDQLLFKGKNSKSGKRKNGSSRSATISRKNGGGSEEDFDGGGARKRDREEPNLSVTQLTHVRKFCEQLSADPTLLEKNKLSFFRDFLQNFKY